MEIDLGIEVLVIVDVVEDLLEGLLHFCPVAVLTQIEVVTDGHENILRVVDFLQLSVLAHQLLGAAGA